MERIEMVYTYQEDKNEEVTKRVDMTKYDKENEGLICSDICEMFRDFMESAGFSVNNVLDYFNG